MALIGTAPRWVLQRPDGRFVCQGNVWGTDIGKAHVWADEDLAERAARIVGPDVHVRWALVTTTIELDGSEPRGT